MTEENTEIKEMLKIFNDHNGPKFLNFKKTMLKLIK